MKTKILILVAIAVIASAFQALNFQKKPWPVPESAKNKKNPIASNAESIETGKSLWSIHCKSCHGSKGLGDGPKAAQLNTEPGDFSKNEFHAQTDGSIFYKISVGRDDMPSFKKKIPDANDIWALVNYSRTLKKGGATTAVTKDTTTPKTDKQVKTVTNSIKKDSTEKIENKVVEKTENVPIQEQVNRLSAKIDSLGKEINLLKEKIDSLNKRKS